MRYVHAHKPSGSMVVAIIALVVATTGGAYAASRIDGKNLVRNSVASSKIENRTLKSKDFSNQARRDLQGERGERGPKGRRGRRVRRSSPRRSRRRARSSLEPASSTYRPCR